MNIDVYVNKLLQAWIKHDNIRVLVDFDDTLKPFNTATDDFCSDLISLLIEVQKYNAKVILWSCRCGERLLHAIEYCEDKGLKFDEVNPTNPFLIDYSQKPFGNIQLDDKAGLEQSVEILKKTFDKYKVYKNETYDK